MSDNVNIESKREAEFALTRMQNFDVNQLPRISELGSELNFSDAVKPAERLISLYKRLSVTALDDLSLNALRKVSGQANDNYLLLNQIVDFKISAQQNPQATRDEYVRQLINAYDPSFQELHPLIAYSLHRAADFQRLDSEARATMQAVTDRAEILGKKLNDHESEANKILENIRSLAAEQGVTQQSIHFKNEADYHEGEAEVWRKRAINFAWCLGVYAVLSIGLHKIPFLIPNNSYETIQLAISKFLIFSVLAYMLFLSARNFLNHKHNSVVNRHRQNALMTHKALVDAASESGIRDAIMVQAAGCIFSPQVTGYSGGGNDSQASKSVVELLSKSVSSVE